MKRSKTFGRVGSKGHFLTLHRMAPTDRPTNIWVNIYTDRLVARPTFAIPFYPSWGRKGSYKGRRGMWNY